MIYFDNASTTFPKPIEVKKALDDGLNNYSFNASRGTYANAINTFNMIEETRSLVADVVNTKTNKVIFTSSATEALNMIINGLNLSKGDSVFISPFEHNAVVRVLHLLEVNIILIPFDKTTWVLNETTFNDLVVLKKPKAIIISHVSNSTGYKLPYETVFEIGKKNDCITLLDASQSFAQYEIDPNYIDFIVFAGHKSLYSITGIAGFINLSNINLTLTKVGGTGSDSLNLEMPDELPLKYEAGTQNSLAIYTLNAGLRYVLKTDVTKQKELLVNYLVDKLNNLEQVIIYKPNNIELNGIVSFNLKGFSSNEIGDVLANNFDIAIRVGYHCCPFIKEFLDLDDFFGTIRVSFSPFNTFEEIDTLIDSIKEIGDE